MELVINPFCRQKSSHSNIIVNQFTNIKSPYSNLHNPLSYARRVLIFKNTHKRITETNLHIYCKKSFLFLCLFFSWVLYQVTLQDTLYKKTIPVNVLHL